MEELVRRAVENDADAFLELMDRMSDRMYKTAWSILKNNTDAADAIQDTILTCFEKIGTLREPRYFSTWVTRILINECYQIQKQYKRYEDSTELPEFPAGEDGMEKMRFQELLSLADERYHLILTLYYADEYSVAEIAAMLDMNENTVKTRLARAREQIRRGFCEESRISYGH
ncbi:MAG: sigma-70 family RNA polymerase sigma factor [Blautia sp.]|nr:sigma-70 family RNA polymerase sigma factor [Blautia sp.]